MMYFKKLGTLQFNKAEVSMKIRQHVCLLGAVIMTFGGCAGTSKVANVKTSTQTKSNLPAGMDESFDPLTLGDYDLDVRKSKDEENDIDFSFLAEANIDTASLPAEAAGYRVQIFSSTDQDEANAVRRDAILRFDENVYLIFDNPYYKVRVGDCLSRYKAEALQIEAEKKEYLDAWVVRTKITLRKTETTGQP